MVANGNFSTVSDTTIDTGSLLPDVKAIDETALGAPYRQVETEITDPDIASYFHALMTETGLDKAGLSHWKFVRVQIGKKSLLKNLGIVAKYD